jgi:hypothetical protein
MKPKEKAFVDRIAQLPEKERNAFWNGIMAVVDAGVKTGTSPKAMAGYWGAYFKEVDQHSEKNA